MRIKPSLDKNIKDLLLKGSFGSIALTTAGLIVGFLLHVFLAQSMQVSQYGSYSYAFTWLSVLALFTPLGMDAVILRYGGKYLASNQISRLKGLLSYSKKLGLYTSLLLLLSALIISLFLYRSGLREYALLILVTAFSLPFITLIIIRQSVLRVLKFVILARLPEVIIRPVLVIIFIALSLYLGIEITSIVALACTALAVLVAYGTGEIFISRTDLSKYKETDIELHTKEWLSASLPLMLVSVSYVFLNYIDTLMLGLWVSMDNVGIYSVASRVSFFVLFGMQAVNMVSAPIISANYEGKTSDEFNNLISLSARIIFALSVPIVIMLLIFSEFLLGLFGKEYIAGVNVLLILVIGQCVNVLFGPVGTILNMTGYQKESVKILIYILALNIILNIPGIIYYGIEGAAAATAFSIGLRNYLMWLLVKKKIGVDASLVKIFTN